MAALLDEDAPYERMINIDAPERLVHSSIKARAPSPGGQVSGMARGAARGTLPGWAALCGIPSTSQKATTRQPGAQS